MINLLIAAAVVTATFSFKADSGLSVGDSVTPFHPQHVTGPNKGTDACPP